MVGEFLIRFSLLLVYPGSQNIALKGSQMRDYGVHWVTSLLASPELQFSSLKSWHFI
jgi:hypothetical protein